MNIVDYQIRIISFAVSARRFVDSNLLKTVIFIGLVVMVIIQSLRVRILAHEIHYFYHQLNC